MTITKGLPERYSPSALMKFLTCEKQWEFSYLHNLPRSSGWAAVGGQAVHLTSERYDLWSMGRVS